MTQNAICVLGMSERAESAIQHMPILSFLPMTFPLYCQIDRQPVITTRICSCVIKVCRALAA